MQIPHFPRATGMALDIREYGAWMLSEAEKRIGQHYPNIQLPAGGTAKVMAWLWARTVRCPNPACSIQMPLARSFWLSKKGNRPFRLEPVSRSSRTRARSVPDSAAPVSSSCMTSAMSESSGSLS